MSHFRLLCLFFIIFDDSDHVKGKSRGNDDDKDKGGTSSVQPQGLCPRVS